MWRQPVAMDTIFSQESTFRCPSPASCPVLSTLPSLLSPTAYPSPADTAIIFSQLEVSILFIVVVVRTVPSSCNPIVTLPKQEIEATLFQSFTLSCPYKVFPFTTTFPSSRIAMEFCIPAEMVVAN